MKHIFAAIAILISSNAYCAELGKCNQPYLFPIVSVVELIASPERWSGKEISVVGFGVFEYEGDSVYFHKEDYFLALNQNAVALEFRYNRDHTLIDKSIKLKGLNKSYIRVAGTFVARPPGEPYMSGETAGGITNICFVEPWQIRRK